MEYTAEYIFYGTLIYFQSQFWNLDDGGPFKTDLNFWMPENACFILKYMFSRMLITFLWLTLDLG